jgi:hypothetical protein
MTMQGAAPENLLFLQKEGEDEGEGGIPPPQAGEEY